MPGRGESTARALRGALPVAALSLAGTAAAECRLLLAAELPVDTGGNRPIIQGSINGRPLRILVDTGSFGTFLQRDAAQRLGLALRDHSELRVWGIGGERAAQETTAEEFHLGQFGAASVRFAVLPDPIPGVDMTLGENFLARFAVEFDLPHGKMRLFKPVSCEADQVAYWSKTYSLAKLQERPDARSRIVADVQINGRTFQAELDSGAAMTLVGTGAAAAAGVTHEQAEPGSDLQLRGSGAGTLPSWVARFPSFALGDEAIKNARLRVAELGAHTKATQIGSRLEQQLDVMPDMLLGMDFLLSHRVLVDGGSRWMVFTYEGGPVFQVVHPEAPPPAPAAAAAPAEPPAK